MNEKQILLSKQKQAYTIFFNNTQLNMSTCNSIYDGYIISY